MKKNILLVSIFICIALIMFSIYSNKLFKTYNFLNSFSGLVNLNEEKPTKALNDNLILIKEEFQEEYLNYLEQIYETKGWYLKTKEKNKYVYCDKEKCDEYFLYTGNFLSKKYALLELKKTT